MDRKASPDALAAAPVGGIEKLRDLGLRHLLEGRQCAPDAMIGRGA